MPTTLQCERVVEAARSNSRGFAQVSNMSRHAMRAGSYSYNDVRYSRCIFIEDRNIGEPSNSHYELHAYY